MGGVNREASANRNVGSRELIGPKSSQFAVLTSYAPNIGHESRKERQSSQWSHLIIYILYLALFPI